MNREDLYTPPLTNFGRCVGMQTIDAARRITFWPGIAMTTLGVFTFAIFAFATVAEINQRGINRTFAHENLFILNTVLMMMFFLGPFLAYCGWQMIQVRSRRLLYAGAVLSLVLFFPVGLVVGVWAISTLNRPLVCSALRAGPIY